MLTIVLSGGANFGAMQAGALEALFEAGIEPNMAVGTSAGALNSIYLASDPTLEGMKELQENWRRVGTSEVGMPRPIKTIRRLITGAEGLIDNEPLATFLNGAFPEGVENFGQLYEMHQLRAYATAVCMETGDLVAFGDNDEDRMIDGAMSSSAVPPFYAPWRVGDCRYMDGGLKAKLPLMVAVERGASQIIALDIQNAMGSLENANSMINITGYSISMMIEDQTRREVKTADASGVGLRVFTLVPPGDVDFWDYEQVEQLIEMGREQVRNELVERPIELAPQWQIRMRQGLANLFRRS
ncbi:MAG: hypothetical protein GTO18_21140 [Anaerolineales bacterium]|nr:hypothetical protein [Anaerolineales bacterium]